MMMMAAVLKVSAAKRAFRWLFLAVVAFSLPVLVVGVVALRNTFGPGSVEPSGSPFAPGSPLMPVDATLKVVTFNIQNTWVVGQHRPERMRAIGKTLTTLDPDLVAFQEALVDDDREILLGALRGSRLKYSHYFRSRRWGSGLLVCSAWPIRETGYHRFSQSGEWYKVWEGDWWVGKGVALARIELPGGAIADFYTTHTQAGYSTPRYHEVRRTQLAEMAAFIARTRWRRGPRAARGRYELPADSRRVRGFRALCRLGTHDDSGERRGRYFRRARSEFSGACDRNSTHRRPDQNRRWRSGRSERPRGGFQRHQGNAF